jgi:hypothetical protein
VVGQVRVPAAGVDTVAPRFINCKIDQGVALVADLVLVISHCVPAARAAMACGLAEMVE